MRSKVTDNVKCILKTLFERQNVGKLCPLEDGATEPPAPFSAAYRLFHQFKCLIPGRVGIKNISYKSMFYMSHVVMHMNGLKDIKCLRV